MIRPYQLSMVLTVLISGFIVVGGMITLRTAIRLAEDDALDPKRAMGAGELMVQYLQSNNDKWPEDWHDIEQFVSGSEIVGIGDFDELRKHIEIDFDFDLSSIDRSQEIDYDHAPFRAVWLRNGRTISMNDSPEPNTMILLYLKKREPVQDK